MLRDKLLIKDVLQMAHDIRSPLFALQVILQAPGEFSDKKRNLLFQATERLREIADGILDHKKTIVKTDLKALIKEIVTEKQISYPNYQIEFFFFNEDIASLLHPVEMKRIISNLLNNSIEASKENKNPIRISLMKINGVVHIIVRDNGKGIPLSLIPKIYKSGLGLSHAKFYIESIGGSIDVTSSKLGTEISIKI